MRGVPNWQPLKAFQGCASSVTRAAKLLNSSPNVRKSAILGFGIWNTAQGIRNPTNDWNAESKCHWQRIQNPDPGIWNPRFGTQNPRLSWIPLHGAKTQLSWHDVLVKTPFIFIYCIFKKSRLQFKVETKIVFHPWHYLQSSLNMLNKVMCSFEDFNRKLLRSTLWSNNWLDKTGLGRCMPKFTEYRLRPIGWFSNRTGTSFDDG